MNGLGGNSLELLTYRIDAETARLNFRSWLGFTLRSIEVR